MKLSIDLGESYNDPIKFVECAALAEELGIETVWFGDHFIPWSHSGNKSAYVWSVMAAALERTKRIKIGPNVTCPIGGRFHPAIIAQAVATLDNMYPGRILLGVGSGEAMNEARFFPGSKFPNWRERIERLAEACELMRKLWKSEEYFSFDGKHFQMKDVFLYTKPRSGTIPIYFSAIGAKAAGFAGKYGDHLVTMNTPENCRDVIFPAFEKGALEAGKNPMKMERMAHLETYFGDEKSGIKRIRETGEDGILAPGAFTELDPRKIERMGKDVSDDKIRENKFFIDSPEYAIDIIERYRRVGATRVNFSTSSFPENIRFVAEKIIPILPAKLQE
jgi:coenzyme F420-dependent glucose-6-phosphate dehydrogenase